MSTAAENYTDIVHFFSTHICKGNVQVIKTLNDQAFIQRYTFQPRHDPTRSLSLVISIWHLAQTLSEVWLNRLADAFEYLGALVAHVNHVCASETTCLGRANIYYR